MSGANVTLIEGQMGEGKTTTAAAIAVDAYHADPEGMKIFANFHFYGIKAVYCDPAMMIQYMNSSLITKGIMIIDEAYITGDARQGMNALAKVFTWFGQQMRKRQIELYILVQHGRFIDWRFRFIMNRRVLCSYNENNYRVRLLIKDMKKGTQKQMSYYAPQYWQYYDTNELPAIPGRALEKAAAWT